MRFDSHIHATVAPSGLTWPIPAQSLNAISRYALTNARRLQHRKSHESANDVQPNENTDHSAEVGDAWTRFPDRRFDSTLFFAFHHRSQQKELRCNSRPEYFPWLDARRLGCRPSLGAYRRRTQKSDRGLSSAIKDRHWPLSEMPWSAGSRSTILLHVRYVDKLIFVLSTPANALFRHHRASDYAMLVLE